MKTYFTFLFLVVYSMPSFGQIDNPIVIDGRQSMYFGAYNLNFAYQLLNQVEDRYVPDTLFHNGKKFNKFLNATYRFSKLMTIDHFQAHYTKLLQHEVFGHGARYREFGFKGNAFNIQAPLPFGSGGAYATSPSYNIENPQKNLARLFGGIESSTLYSQTIAQNSLLNNSFHYKDALLYIKTNNDFFRYALITFRRYDNNSLTYTIGGDIGRYLFLLNEIYVPYSNNNTYKINYIFARSFLTLANPYQIFSFYTLGNYVLKGKKGMKNIPMIKFGKFRYLPALGYNMTPFGTEYVFNNYVKLEKRLFNLEISVGDGFYEKFYNVTAKAFDVLNHEKISLNIYGTLWNQPEMDLNRNFFEHTPNKIGGALKADITFRPNKANENFGFFLQTGYKTKGYLLGEYLDANFIFRFGMSIRM